MLAQAVAVLAAMTLFSIRTIFELRTSPLANIKLPNRYPPFITILPLLTTVRLPTDVVNPNILVATKFDIPANVRLTAAIST